MEFNLTSEQLAYGPIKEAFTRLLYAGGFGQYAHKAGDSWNGKSALRETYAKQLIEAIVQYEAMRARQA